MRDLSIDAADTARGLEVFRREGVVVAKGLLPVPLVEKTAGFLRQELDWLDWLFRRYGISMDDAVAPTRLAELMEPPAGDPHTQALGELLPDMGRSSTARWLPSIERGAFGHADRVILEPLALGDAVVFSPRTVHESMPNVSDRARLSCNFRFFGEQVQSGKHFLDLARDTIVAPEIEEA